MATDPSTTSPSTGPRGQTRPAEDGDEHPGKRARTRARTKRQPTEAELQAREKIQRIVAAIVQPSPEEDDATTTWSETSGNIAGGVEPDELDLDELSVEEVIYRMQTTRELIDKAVRKEVDNLEAFKVFSRVREQDLPEGVRVLGSTMVMAERPGKGLKARICAQDFNNAVRDDVFQPNAKLEWTENPTHIGNSDWTYNSIWRLHGCILACGPRTR